jgi:hypothetical protein
MTVNGGTGLQFAMRCALSRIEMTGMISTPDFCVHVA